MRRGEAGGSGCRAHLARQLRVARCPSGPHSLQACPTPPRWPGSGARPLHSQSRRAGPSRLRQAQACPGPPRLSAASNPGWPGGGRAGLSSPLSGSAMLFWGAPFPAAGCKLAVRCALSAHSCLPRGSPQARAVSVRPGIAHSRGSAPRSALGKGHEPPPVPLSHAPPQPGMSCCYFNLQSVDAEHTTLHSLALVKPVTSHQKRDYPPHPPPSAREPRGHRPRGRSLPSVSL